MDEAVFVDWEFTQQLQRLYLSGDKEEERQLKTCRTSSGSGVNLSIDRSKESAMLFIKYNNSQQFLKDIYTVFKSRLFLLSVAVAFYCEQSLFFIFIFFHFLKCFLPKLLSAAAGKHMARSLMFASMSWLWDSVVHWQFRLYCELDTMT